VSVTATVVALRGEVSTIAISPNVSSGPSLRTAPLGVSHVHFPFQDAEHLGALALRQVRAAGGISSN
jgi:hypothetical protein